MKQSKIPKSSKSLQTPQLSKRPKYFKYLKFLIAFLVPVAATMVFTNQLDNDSWYVLTEGREIIENGIYHTDQLSMHEGLEVTVQNYGFAVIFYLIYSAFGGIGIYISMLLVNVLLCYIIYKLCMLISKKHINLSLIIMMVTNLLLVTTGFVVTRAQMVSYVIFMTVIYLLELYVREGKKKPLYLIPLLSLIQINLHSSLWPMLIIVISVYIIDSFRIKNLPLQGYPTKPLLILLAASFLVGFLNPYGFKMMTLMFSSYGVPEVHDFISELYPFNLGNRAFILLYAAIAIALILYIYGKNRNIRVRYLLFLSGFLALGINTIKGMSQFILVLVFPLAEIYQDIRIESWGSRTLRWMTASWVGLLAATIIIVYSVVMIPEIRSDGPSDEMVAVMDVLDRETREEDRAALKIYCYFDDGGYVEFRGYHSYMDPRVEVFLKANNGKEDTFLEYYDLESGKLRESEFLPRYDFGYIVTREGFKLYDLVDYPELGYELIYEKDDEFPDENEIYGVRLYKKINV